MVMAFGINKIIASMFDRPVDNQHELFFNEIFCGFWGYGWLTRYGTPVLARPSRDRLRRDGRPD